MHLGNTAGMPGFGASFRKGEHMQSHRMRMHIAAAVVMFASLLLASLSTVAAEQPANECFDRT